jgi:hypothetical protein
MASCSGSAYTKIAAYMYIQNQIPNENNDIPWKHGNREGEYPWWPGEVPEPVRRPRSTFTKEDITIDATAQSPRITTSCRCYSGRYRQVWRSITASLQVRQ